MHDMYGGIVKFLWSEAHFSSSGARKCWKFSGGVMYLWWGSCMVIVCRKE